VQGRRQGKMNLEHVNFDGAGRCLESGIDSS
jgi:hypothetical protein